MLLLLWAQGPFSFPGTKILQTTHVAKQKKKKGPNEQDGWIVKGKYEALKHPFPGGMIIHHRQ